MMTAFRSTKSRFYSIPEVERMAPSVFAEEAAENVSSRYQFVSTKQILESFQNSGYGIVDVQSSKRTIFGKHMIAFQHTDAQIVKQVGDTVPRIILFNSHDGKSAWRMFAGLMRLVCLNGLLASNGVQGSVSVRHSGNNVLENVAEGIHSISEYLPSAFDIMGMMKGRILTNREMESFAIGAIALRFAKPKKDILLPNGYRIPTSQFQMDDEEEVKDVTHSMDDDEDESNDAPVVYAPVGIEQVLRPRRTEDRENDVYTVYNRVQENIRIPGRGMVMNKRGYREPRKIREMKGVEDLRKLNIGLWSMAASMVLDN